MFFVVWWLVRRENCEVAGVMTALPKAVTFDRCRDPEISHIFSMPP